MNGHGPSDGAAVELALDESAEELYEMAPCGYLTTTVGGQIVKMNRTLTEWLGYDRAELTGGTRFVDLLTVGGRIFFETHLALLLRVRDSVDEIALDLVCRDGRLLPALVNARQKRDALGAPVLNRFTIFNASERRMYERELLAARDLLRTTLASIGDAVIATDAEGRITFTNGVADDLTGWPDRTALGRPIEEVLVLLREDTENPMENPIRHSLRVGAVVGLEDHAVLVAKDGRRIPIDDSASPMRDANDNLVGGVLVFRDISERRKAEKALFEAHLELESRASELRRSNEDLSQFAHVASHDLRSPLNTVVQFAQLLDRNYGDQLGNGRELIGHLTGAAQRMARLIEDLLRYASVTAGTDASPAPLDSHIPFEQAIGNLHSAIEASGAVVTRDVLPVIPVDQTGLTQIFQNLIGNAIHYRGTAPLRIHIAVAESREGWVFSCADNGIGIAPEYQVQIFQPFKRLHGSDRPGSGIGLAVCKKIVERHKGRIWVESEEGRGATFFFSIPRS